MRVLLLAALAALVAAPLAAQNSRAVNDIDVTPTSGGFAVQGDGGTGARAMWCAAADYAFKRAGAAGADRLYISEGRTPGIGQRAAVTFTLDPDGLTPSAVLVTGLSLRSAGANLSVGHARSFCSNTSPSAGGSR
tara:strand:+ start:3677 stop:4081 length:405 start_codon:yes stop_codon:yes gene_type:complete